MLPGHMGVVNQGGEPTRPNPGRREDLPDAPEGESAQRQQESQVPNEGDGKKPSDYWRGVKSGFVPRLRGI